MTSSSDLGPLLALVLTALSILNILYTWWRTRDQNVESRFKAGSERMDRLDSRLASVEQTLRAQPTKEDMHALHLAMRDMQGEFKAMSATMEGNNKIMSRLEAIVARHEDHLLGGAR
ncbi:DUF2730 family protein [Cereibacter azotoformans]|uniref:Uncharacterized protein DUF2730 n=2 Tax=Cereibacter TaxID=1653176 RepID=A0A2T5JSF2_9RHOB|nr:DUF2730 family protein [Cereibacter azotoformans]MBO4168888.1 DUF2730 family protein [Cereibacter azotoformans]PTR11164.1 uncharacterized protein DUF2730 [Cereibacter azotoformans]